MITINGNSTTPESGTISINTPPSPDDKLKIEMSGDLRNGDYYVLGIDSSEGQVNVYPDADFSSTGINTQPYAENVKANNGITTWEINPKSYTINNISGKQDANTDHVLFTLYSIPSSHSFILYHVDSWEGAAWDRHIVAHSVCAYANIINTINSTPTCDFPDLKDFYTPNDKIETAIKINSSRYVGLIARIINPQNTILGKTYDLGSEEITQGKLTYPGDFTSTPNGHNYIGPQDYTIQFSASSIDAQSGAFNIQIFPVISGTKDNKQSFAYFHLEQPPTPICESKPFQITNSPIPPDEIVKQTAKLRQGEVGDDGSNINPPAPTSPCAPGKFREGYKCNGVNTGLGITIITSPTGFVGSLFAFLLSIAGMIALFLIIQSGYVMMTSSGNPEKVQGAKETLTSAIVGLLFIIFSLAILQIIGADILKIPQFSP